MHHLHAFLNSGFFNRTIFTLCFLYLLFLGYDAYKNTDSNIDVRIDGRQYKKQVKSIDGQLLDPRQAILFQELTQRFEIKTSFDSKNHDKYFETLAFQTLLSTIENKLKDKDVNSLSFEINETDSVNEIDSTRCSNFKSDFLSMILIIYQDPHIQLKLQSSYQESLKTWYDQAKILYRNPFTQATHTQATHTQATHPQAIHPSSSASLTKFDQNLIFLPSVKTLSNQINQMSCSQIISIFSFKPILFNPNLHQSVKNAQRQFAEIILFYYLSPWLSITRYDQGVLIFIPFQGVKWVKAIHDLDERLYDFTDLISDFKDLRTRRW